MCPSSLQVSNEGEGESRVGERGAFTGHCLFVKNLPSCVRSALSHRFRDIVDPLSLCAEAPPQSPTFHVFCPSLCSFVLPQNEAKDIERGLT